MTIEVSEEGARAFVEEIVGTTLVLFKAMIYFGGQDLPANAIKGIAAMRCALTSGFDQSYLLILSAYFALLQFNKTGLLINGLNELYPHVCTCSEDAITIQGWMGVDTNDRAKTEKLAALDTCSEGAAASKKKGKYRNYMNALFNATNPDFAKAAREIIQNTDTNYDNLVSAEEFAEALFLGFDISPSAEDREWVVYSLSELCGQYNTDGNAGLDAAQMENCLTNKGSAIWEGAKQWAAEKKASTYDPAIWDTIFDATDRDANSDG